MSESAKKLNFVSQITEKQLYTHMLSTIVTSADVLCTY